jgi:hypothetical protein
LLRVCAVVASRRRSSLSTPERRGRGDCGLAWARSAVQEQRIGSLPWTAAARYSPSDRRKSCSQTFTQESLNHDTSLASCNWRVSGVGNMPTLAQFLSNIPPPPLATNADPGKWQRGTEKAADRPQDVCGKAVRSIDDPRNTSADLFGGVNTPRFTWFLASSRLKAEVA